MLYAICVFAVNAEFTRDNVAWIIGLPMRVAELIFGDAQQLDKGTVSGALRYTGYHTLNLAWLYLIAALIRRTPPSLATRSAG